MYCTKLAEGCNMDKLEAIGEKTKDSYLSTLFLCSLLPRYDRLITAVEARTVK